MFLEVTVKAKTTDGSGMSVTARRQQHVDHGTSAAACQPRHSQRWQHALSHESSATDLPAPLVPNSFVLLLNHLTCVYPFCQPRVNIVY